jgi:hypothetical protein
MAMVASVAMCEHPKRTVPLTTASELRGTVGHVTASQREDGETEVQVTAERLSRPDEVERGMRAYVVWAMPLRGERAPQKLGTLEPDERARAELSGVVPAPGFDVRVTLEPGADARAPNGAEVMRASLPDARTGAH